MKIDAPRIKSWVERIERLLEERAALNSDIKDIYAEIKAGDHDAKAIRKLIQRRAQDEADLAEQDALLAAYTDAVAGKARAAEALARGATVREAAKAGGISTGSAAALAHVQKSRNLNTENGATSDTAPGDDTRTPEPSRSAEVVAKPTITDEEAWAAADAAREALEAAKRRVRAA